MYHTHAEYCRLFSHARLMRFDYQGFAVLHAKVNTQAMDAVWVAAIILESPKFMLGLLEGGRE